MKKLAVALMLLAGSAAASSEPRTTDTGAPEKWTEGMTLVLDPSLETLGPGATDAVRVALGTWLSEVAHLPNVSFEVATSPGVAALDGTNRVLAGPITTAGQENDLAYTTTYADSASGDIFEADIVFNTKYAYADVSSLGACATTWDIGAVATHEAGHFFGLGEDYTDLAATMYVTTAPCDVHKRVLTDDDTSTLAALYAPPTLVVAHCATSPVPAGGGGWTLGGLAAAWLLVRVRTRGGRRPLAS